MLFKSKIASDDKSLKCHKLISSGTATSGYKS